MSDDLRATVRHAFGHLTYYDWSWMPQMLRQRNFYSAAEAIERMLPTLKDVLGGGLLTDPDRLNAKVAELNDVQETE